MKNGGLCGVGFVAFLWFYPLVRGVDKHFFGVVMFLRENVCDNVLGVRMIGVSKWWEILNVRACPPWGQVLGQGGNFRTRG